MNDAAADFFLEVCESVICAISDLKTGLSAFVSSPAPSFKSSRLGFALEKKKKLVCILPNPIAETKITVFFIYIYFVEKNLETHFYTS